MTHPDITALLQAKEAAFIDLLRESGEVRLTLLWAAAACLLDYDAKGPEALERAARHLAILAKHGKAVRS